MKTSFKNKILALREQGFSYSKIKRKLNCSKATIGYHCKMHSLTDIGLLKKKLPHNKVIKVAEYYKNNTAENTAQKFKISVSTVKKYTAFIEKRIILTPFERKKRAYIRVKTRRQKMKEQAVKYKGGKCEICGYDKCVWAFDFHHKNSNEKDFNISKNSHASWANIKKEIDKCILICSNCHRELHYKENLAANPSD